MSSKANEILKEILLLPPSEREDLVDNILASLGGDPRVVAAWAAEAEDRVAAFERNEIETVSAESVFEEIDRQRSS